MTCMEIQSIKFETICKDGFGAADSIQNIHWQYDLEV